MALVKDKNDGYIQYRFGNKDHVEMAYPAEKNKDSWKKFKYRSYMRGGGKQNAGMELNYLTFSNNGYQYQLFRTYYAEDSSYATGITVTGANGKETNINGIYKSIKGCMCHLQESDLIEKEDTGL